jgi:glycogen(starch) synthase
MRTIFWSELFWPYMGGAQVSAINLLRGLRERGHEFIVVTRQDEPGLPNEGCFQGFPIYRFPFYSALAEGKIDRLAQIREQIVRLKRRFAPDLVHVNCFGPSILFHLDTIQSHPARLLVTLRGERYKPSPTRDTLQERLLRAADWVTGPSLRTVEYARRLVPGFVPRSSHIYNGIETPSLVPAPLPVHAPRLLCLGRLVPNKGVDLALFAMAEVIQRFPQARMVIAGDGPARRELERQTADLGLGNAVSFVGWVAPHAVPALINTASLVVIPSRGWEALPLVALEAAFMGRPVVAARDGGLPEVVAHGETGLLVEKEDAAGLAVALSVLLDEPHTAIRMGQAARQRAHELFSMERCVDGYDALYRKLGAAASRLN